MSFLDNITEYLTSENRRLSTKAAFVIVAIFLIVLVDNVLGFSFHFRTDRKIDELQKVAAIINNPNIDTTTKAYATTIRSDIMERKNFIDYSFSFFRNTKLASSKRTQINKPTEIPKTSEVPIRNDLLFKISAGGIYFLIGFLSIPLILFTDKKTPLLVKIATGLVTGVMLIMFGLALTWLLELIPLLTHSTWWWNYLINFILQLLFTAGFIYFSIHSNKN